MRNQGRVDYDETSADKQENEIRALLKGRSRPARSITKIVLFVVAGVIGLFVVAAKFAGGGNSDLQVTLEPNMINNSILKLVITNTGEKSVTIEQVSINERRDCDPQNIYSSNGAEKFPMKLRVGDNVRMISICTIVRASITDPSGTYTYKFSR